jgi:hypothetical protein
MAVVPAVLGVEHAADLIDRRAVLRCCAAAVLQWQAGNRLGVGALVLRHPPSMARQPDVPGKTVPQPEQPEQPQQPQQPQYYLSRPGRGSKTPRSLSEWIRRERVLRLLATSAGDEPPPPWLN